MSDKVADPAPARTRAPHRANGRRSVAVTTPEVAAIEAEFARLVDATDGADFLLACAAEQQHVIAGLQHAMQTHHVGCSTIRAWAVLLLRVQNEEIARAEHIVNVVVPECQCAIAEREAALADRKAA